ncbi:MAG: prepilin-type N-terminal cleavage/methylation domain-containing protein [Actinomycetota bacterium]
MLKRIRRENEDGFTLIELMVVVLIISILIAIAIPTFLGAREGAQDRGAQSNLRNALTAAKTSYADAGDFEATGAALITELAAIEPSLAFDSVAPGTAGTPASLQNNYVQVTWVDDQEVVFTALSETGDTFQVREIAQPSAGTAEVAGTNYQNTPSGGAASGWQTTSDAGW